MVTADVLAFTTSVETHAASITPSGVRAADAAWLSALMSGPQTRYVGPSVMIAIVAALYAGVPANRLADGASRADALAGGFQAAAIALTIIAACGIVLVYLVRGSRPTRTTMGVDVAIAAAAPAHTIPPPDPGP